jgi:lipopolysaccharide/colanic/teichoic acid biosynthesis glycosyltransferase
MAVMDGVKRAGVNANATTHTHLTIQWERLCVATFLGIMKGIMDTSGISTWVNHPLKRAVDICVVILLLPFLLWIISLQCVLVILIDRASPIIWQSRIGMHGKRFKLCKVNTMGTFVAYDSGRGANDKRATPLGRVLRLMILDEVPQIVINVLRGDMTLVGPRPLLSADLRLMKRRLSRAEYQSWYVAYLRARERLDILYVQSATPRMDMRVFLIHAALPFLDTHRHWQRPESNDRTFRLAGLRK